MPSQTYPHPEEARSAVSKDAGSSCSRGLVHPAKGESMTLATAEPFKAPQVASLSVRVVVDSFFDQFMPKAMHPHVAIEHVSRIRGRETTTLAGEWGLSLHLESKSAGAGGQYLLDFGYTPEILLRNFDLLGIVPERLDGLILSHAHRDHYGGMVGFVEDHRGRLVPDRHPDEHATCYVVEGRGLVVISSCGHCGLINTIRTAMAVANVAKLHAVIGGFHLGVAPPDYVEHTIAELKALQPDVVLPMHCSGRAFLAGMAREMPDRLVLSNTGSRFTFGV